MLRFKEFIIVEDIRRAILILDIQALRRHIHAHETVNDN